MPRAVLLGLALVVLPGCAGADRGSGGEPLSVWTAASASAAVERFARGRVMAGGLPARVNPDATSRLAAQLQAGAPADVFVSADRRWMNWAVERELVDPASVRLVAGNSLVLVTATTSPVGPGGVAELLAPGGPVSTLGLAGEEVPAGRYAREALAGAPAGQRVITGGSVRSVAEWAATGQVDAAVVYGSDAIEDPRLRVVAEFDPTAHSPVEVLAAVVASSARPREARDFVDALAGAEGLAAFQAAGFLAPSAQGPGSSDSARVAAVSGRETSLGVSATSAVWISVRVALLATLLSLVPAVLLGWLLARRDFPGKSALNAVILAPMVIPPVVTGFLLLWLVGSNGPLGGLLAGVGLTVPFSFGAAVVAAAVVGFPLFVITVRNAFETVDPGLEEMARTLGSTPFQAFRRVTLPLARSGIAAGMILAFARALGEFGATVVLAGNLEGETRTIALAVYTLLEAPAGQRQVWVLVGASVAISFLALAVFETLSRRQRRLVRRGGHV